MSKRSKVGAESREPGRVRGWRIAFLVLCTVGVCLQADLVRLHLDVHTDPDYQSYCAMSERVNCETVAASPYAVFLDLPLAVWGVLAYLALGTLTVWGLRSRPRVPTWPFGALFWMTACATAVSVYLFYLSHFVVGSICIVCATSYLVNAMLFAVAYLELRRCRIGIVQAVAQEWGAARAKPRSVVVVAASFLAIAAVLWIGIPRYWKVELPSEYDGLAKGRTVDGHPWIGASRPVLEIVEFSDYQCPHCRRGHDEVRTLAREHPDRVRIVHRNYPLDDACNPTLRQPFHPWACAYARLAVCADEQDGFWQANDYLFTHGRRREQVTAEEIASALDLDGSALSSCVDSERASQAVALDLDAGRRLGVRGTPTFVIGGRTYPGRIPPDVLRAALEPPVGSNASP